MNIPKSSAYKILCYAGAALTCVCVLILWIHRVDNTITVEDEKYILKVMNRYGLRIPAESVSYEEERAFIIGVQKAVLSVVPCNEGIEFGQRREPKDQYEKGCGLCYDRSRFIEKILRYAGFRVRHVALYSTMKTGSKIKTLLTPKPGSHSITEVKTQKGWLVVDSNEEWVSLDDKGNPVSMKEIQKDSLRFAIQWDPFYYPRMVTGYKWKFIYIYGLYSRHGQFYPPFNFIPDINWVEFLANFAL